MKKVFLSQSNKKIAGVLGGIGEAFDIDPTILRILAILLAVITGILPVVIAYIVWWMITPKRGNGN